MYPAPGDRITNRQQKSAGCVYIPAGNTASRNENLRHILRTLIELKERPEDDSRGDQSNDHQAGTAYRKFGAMKTVHGFSENANKRCRQDNAGNCHAGVPGVLHN
jgi:hypothetical protein